jgi:archaellum component FlaC
VADERITEEWLERQARVLEDISAGLETVREDMAGLREHMARMRAMVERLDATVEGFLEEMRALNACGDQLDRGVTKPDEPPVGFT